MSALFPRSRRGRCVSPILVAVFSCLIASCGAEEDQTHEPRIEEAERELGAEQHPRLLAEFGGSYDAGEAAYVKGIARKIEAAAGLTGQCTFTLVNSDVVNAFAVPGCYIYITRGLLGLVNSEAELASVLAHEVGHIVADHGERQQKRSLWRGLGVLAVNLITGSEELTRIAGRAAQFFTLRYSRKQEYESDDLGIRYLKAAGYDPYAAADMLGALARHEQFLTRTRGRDEATSIPEWARTHPLTGNRIARADEKAALTGVADNALPENEASFLSQVDGLLYGDDPEQGFVMGRRFAHPVMRIGFEAPEGFTLTNSPQAILIEGPNGVRGEFGGGRLSSGGLDAYGAKLIKQLFGEARIEVGQAQRGRVNGVSALFIPVRAATENGPVKISFAIYGNGREAYHFVMISTADDDAEPVLRALFNSFRLLTAAEAASLKPREIRVVDVGSDNSIAAFANRMRTDHPVEHFIMLNGLDAGEKPKAGGRVKIVVLAGS